MNQFVAGFITALSLCALVLGMIVVMGSDEGDR